MQNKDVPVKVEGEFDAKDGFASYFMKVWPTGTEEDRDHLNSAIKVDN